VIYKESKMNNLETKVDPIVKTIFRPQ
jgi:hypothetical protein